MLTLDAADIELHLLTTSSLHILTTSFLQIPTSHSADHHSTVWQIKTDVTPAIFLRNFFRMSLQQSRTIKLHVLRLSRENSRDKIALRELQV